MAVIVKRLIILVLLLVPVRPCGGETSLYEGEPGGVLPGHVIFKLREGVGLEKDKLPAPLLDVFSEKDMNGPYRLFPGHEPPSVKYHHSGRQLADLSRIYEVVTGGEIASVELIRAISSTGLVEYVQLRPLPELLFFDAGENDVHYPSDPLLPDQYYLKSIMAFNAWAVFRGDTNTVVAIVDTGTELDHPDLADAIKFNYGDPIDGEDSDGDGYVDNFYGWDLGEGNNDPSFNRSAHGLHVSGIAAATPDNEEGIAGVGYYSKYLPVKVDDEFGRLVKAYEGIVYAADQGASVINCSWGSHFNPGPFGQDIIDYAVLNRDAVVIGAAGNSADNRPLYPASLGNVISVAAVDSLDRKTGFSSYGPYVDLTAPGVRILSTWVNGSYMFSGGTSMAAPVVAGSAAILRSYYPEMDAMQLAAIMKMAADCIDDIEENKEFANQLGFGRINLFRALTEKHRPYITIDKHLNDENEFSALRPGEQLGLAFRLQNLLSASANLKAVLETDCEMVSVLTDTVSIAPLSTYEVTDNLDNPFMIAVSGDLPVNHNVVFTLKLYDSQLGLAGRKSFGRTLNTEYVNIDTGRISTTISSKGAIGFNYPDYTQGRGLTYNNGYTTIRCAGIVIANSTFEIADNIYGADSASFSNSLHPLALPSISDEHPLAPLKVTGSLADLMEDGRRPLGVSVNYSAYFWDDETAGDFFILDYDIINESPNVLGSLNVGFFADWVLRDNKRHRATIDVPSGLAYSYSASGGHYTGIQLLSSSPLRHYAFDKQGAGGSIRIDNGFTGFKKFTAFNSNRMYAGSYREDNDISSLIGGGPHTLAPGDTLSIGFAIHMADDLATMLGNTVVAAGLYDMIGGLYVNVPGDLSKGSLITAYPSPFVDVFTLEIDGGITLEHQLSVYDIYGRKVKGSRINAGQNHRLDIDLGGREIKSGVYILKISGPEVNASQRIIKR